MTEAEMRLKVVALLFEQGLEVCHESNKLSNCDLVGFEFEPRVSRLIPKLHRVWSVELKVRDFAGVLRQAVRHQPRVTKSFAAMPADVLAGARQATLEKFISQGIGMISVMEGGAWIQWDAQTMEVPFGRFRRVFWRHHLHPQFHGTGSRGN